MAVDIKEAAKGFSDYERYLSQMKASGSEALQKGIDALAQKIDSQEDFQAAQSAAVDPRALASKTEKKPLADQAMKIRRPDAKESVFIRADFEKDANNFSGKHKEFKPDDLLDLREKLAKLSVKPPVTKESVLSLVKDSYKEPELVDAALEFLEMTTSSASDEVKKAVQEARQDNFESNPKVVIASRNINPIVQSGMKAGIGNGSELRELHNHISSSLLEANALFDLLMSKYPTFDQLSKVIVFLNKSIGSDLRSSTPSEDPGKLHAVMKEVKSVRFVYGMYKAIKDRTNLVESEFERQNLTMPPQLTLENLAKTFMSFNKDRYLTEGKIADSSVQLGINNSLPSTIIVVNLIFRDLVKQLPIEFYGTVERQNDILSAILACSETCENLLDEQLERMQNKSSASA